MDQTDPEREHLVDEAIDLMIRLRNDPANQVAVEMARAWRARSPEHERIWLRVAAVRGAARQLLQGEAEGETGGRGRLSRRTLVVGGAMGLAAAGAGWSALPHLLRNARADHVTGTAEIRQVALPDGSKAILGPDSAIALDYRNGARAVALLGGMSFFDVVADAGRPFRVTSGTVVSTALGTRFDVSDDAGVLTVEVEQGLVEVRPPASPPAAATRLAAGEWAAYDRQSSSWERGGREAGQIGAWRERLVIAERETVFALAARIGRWLPGRIVVAAPHVGAQRVSGIFDLTDPEHALDAVVRPAGGRVRRLSTFVTVISPI